MSGLVLTGARVLTPFEELDAPVTVQDGRIAAVGAPAPAGAHVLDLGGDFLAPGFVDLHVHGGDGAQFTSADVEACLRAARFHARHGTTALLATTVPAAPERLLAAVTAIGEAARRDDPDGAAILGCHLEGPYVNVKRKGALDPASMRAPDPAEARALAGAGAALRLITLAPELPGALALIEELSAAGTVVSLGHSDATYEETVAAVEAGARHVTHLFNAMRPLHHREPGVLGAALDRPKLTCEVIADGHHLHPAAVRLAHRVKGAAGTALVTDAVEAAGLPEGEYRLGDTAIRVAAGQARLRDGDALAGSLLTMDGAVRNAAAMLATGPAEAVEMATATPARLLGLERKGRIAPGADADLVVLDGELRLRAVMRAGRWIGAPQPLPRLRGVRGG